MGAELFGSIPPSAQNGEIIQREFNSNTHIHNLINKCTNESLSPEERGSSWQEALSTASGKSWVKTQIHQNLLPNEYHEPIIRRSPVIDDRIMESYSPTLKGMVDNNQIDAEASFAILEYFLRTNHHQLTTEQLTALGSWFSPRHTQEFHQYKEAIERNYQHDNLPGKEPFESWVIRREICDMLEIVDNIKSTHLNHVDDKTISYVDLMRIAANVLKTTHSLSSPEGVEACNERDALLLSGKEVDFAKNLTRETIKKLVSRPDVCLGMLISNGERDFYKDMNTIFSLKQTSEIIGQEHIPSNGPLIIAFSHMNNWRDPNIAPNWEMLQMIGSLQDLRINQEVAVAAWIGHFKMVGGESLGAKAGGIINMVLDKLSNIYHINIIDVSKSAPRFEGFLRESAQAIRDGQTFLISPEGAPAQEILRSRPGIGALAKMTGAPVVGVAFRETRLPDGTFSHQLIFTRPKTYQDFNSGSQSEKEKIQEFSDSVMRNIAEQLPEEKRGIYR